jgi:NAD(P)-dependent dehydrogenase (short-subunit alcohol dehydrogenase family)
MTTDTWFTGKTAAITGGASGIGLAVGQELARRGANLVLGDIEAPALERTLAAYSDAGHPVAGVSCDVTSRESVESFADAAFEAFPSVDIVFNNAGVAVGGLIEDMSHDDWKWVIDVDLWGPIHGVEAFLPRLIEQDAGGRMLFTASFAGLAPNFGLGPYCVAKYGVVALAEVLQKELRPHDIGVSVLCPMRVVTNIDNSERNRPGADQNEDHGSSDQPDADFDLDADDMSGRVLPVDGVASRFVDAVRDNQLYVVPHEESRAMIRRRFDRIDAAFS